MGFENLSYANKTFLERHGVSLDLTFDAKGLSPNYWKQELKDSEKFILYNVSPCRKEHSLKTKNGHCIICDTSKIAYASLGTKTGSIYIAGSIKGKILKVGCTTRFDINDRVKELNKENYGFSDWKILFQIEVHRVGEIERKVHKILSKYKIDGIEYFKNLKSQMASELFSCEFEEAKKAVLQSCEIAHTTNKYNPVVLIKNGIYSEYKVVISFMKSIEINQNILTFELDYNIACLKNKINLINQKKNAENRTLELIDGVAKTKIALAKEIKILKLKRASTLETKDVEVIPSLSFAQSLKEETEENVVKFLHNVILKALDNSKVGNVILKIKVERDFDPPILLEFKSSMFKKNEIKKNKAFIANKLSAIWVFPQ